MIRILGGYLYINPYHKQIFDKTPILILSFRDRALLGQAKSFFFSQKSKIMVGWIKEKTIICCAETLNVVYTLVGSSDNVALNTDFLLCFFFRVI